MWHAATCVEHLCTQMIVTVQEGKGDDKALTEKQVAAYFKQFTKSSK